MRLVLTLVLIALVMALPVLPVAIARADDATIYNNPPDPNTGDGGGGSVRPGLAAELCVDGVFGFCIGALFWFI